jgi:hypothetical protein
VPSNYPYNVHIQCLPFEKNTYQLHQPGIQSQSTENQRCKGEKRRTTFTQLPNVLCNIPDVWMFRNMDESGRIS